MPEQPSHPVLRWYGRWDRAFTEGMPDKFRTVLANWLAHQRWFITKEEHAPGIEIEHAWQVQVDQQTVWWLLLHLHDETQTRRFYQLPLVCLEELVPSAKVVAQFLGGQEGWLVDAWSWPPLARFVLERMAANRSELTELAPGLVTWADESLDVNLPAIPVETDQSNTIIRFAERYFFKVFRSLTPGVQPDEEVGRYLHLRQFIHTIPPIAGLHWQQETATTLALCSPFVPNQGSAWSWLVEQLQSVTQEIPKELAEAIELLGQRTAQLHLALAQPIDDRAFKPLPLTIERIRQLQQRVLEKTTTTLEILRQSESPGPDVRALLAAIGQRAKNLQERVLSWQPEEIDGVMTRIHGDYHLGQVLRTKENDWLIIDFEGEPLRPIAERQIKDSPLRDVAGMLRSFAYARLVAQGNEPEKDPERTRPEGNDGLPSAESAWQQVMAQFLQRYFSILQGQKVVPSDPHHLQRLLELYELEKTLYEIEYELKSRPQWLWIPVTGLWQFLGREAKK
jgi:maltose alpha-D-glucosyltransferase/alpha-amylase